MFLLLIGIILVVLLLCIRIVPQATEYVVERLGKYHKTWSAGLKMLVPLIDRISNKVTLKEQVLDSAPQPVITKDNVTMRIDTVEVGVLDLTNCVYGLDKVGVKIELKSSFGSKAADYKKYSGTFLIDCIILEPVKE